MIDVTRSRTFYLDDFYSKRKASFPPAELIRKFLWIDRSSYVRNAASIAFPQFPAALHHEISEIPWTDVYLTYERPTIMDRPPRHRTTR